jgi:hypothetical protein
LAIQPGEQYRFLMGKLTISMAIFNSYVKLAEGTVFGGEIDYEWS